MMKCNYFKKFITALIDFVYPPFCFDCGGKVYGREFFCELCRSLVLRESIPAVERSENHAIDTIIPSFDFDVEIVRKSVHALKYSGIPGPSLELLHHRIPSLELQHYHSVVPIPLHWRRKAKRGYNQAALLAEKLEKMGIADRMIEPIARKRFTETQTHKNRWERKNSMRHVFVMKKSYPPVAGQSILLVDDVCTTGATAEACAVLLKKAGALSVDLITLGRA